MIRAFLDTGYVIALETSDDQHHEQVQQHWQGFLRQKPRLVTTSYVFDEIVTFFNRRGRHEKAVEVGERLLRSASVKMIHKVWKAEFDGSKYRLGYEALSNPAYGPIEELEVYIFGYEEGVSPAHAIKAFEFMHDLEYILAAMPPGRGGRAPLFVEGLDVTNEDEPMRWELNVVSEYGSCYNQTIVNRRKWGYRPE